MEMLGEAIRKIRITKGYSQQYVADSINVSQSTFNRIENGRSEISVPKFLRVCEVLDADPFDFIHNNAVNHNGQ